jgi:hypothetical protein
VKLRSVDRRLGWPLNRTSRVLSGRFFRPRLDELLAVLEAAGIGSREFFRRLGGGPDDPDARRVVELIAEANHLCRKMQGRVGEAAETKEGS